MEETNKFGISYYTEAFTNQKERAFQSVIYSGRPDLTDWLMKNYMFEDDPSGLTRITPNQIQHYILAANTIASRVAMNAGLDYSVCLRLHDNYIDAISHCINPSLLSQTFRQMIYDYANRVNQSHALPSSHPIVKAVVSSTQKLLYEKLSTSVIAADLKLSTPYLCRVFRHETGMTISDYILEQKITEARRLLMQGSLSVSEISASLNFTTPSRFCHLFKKLTGVSPGKFRIVNSNDMPAMALPSSKS